MTIRAHNSMLLVLAMSLCGSAYAQTAASAGVDPSTVAPSLASRGESLDHIVAIVNQDIILESDVQEEIHFLAFEPYHTQTRISPRDQALERLINRTLILQQEKLQPQEPISDAEVQAQIQQLRSSIPACDQKNCETEAGWTQYLAEHDFTEEELEARWRERMTVLRFIEVRFRSGVRITPQQISEYYQQTMLPEYVKQKATPPPLESISKRIEEVLLQRQVTSLLNGWLKTLRDQGSVRTLQAGEEAP